VSLIIVKVEYKILLTLFGVTVVFNFIANCCNDIPLHSGNKRRDRHDIFTSGPIIKAAFTYLAELLQIKIPIPAFQYTLGLI
jgi:hypothetical protein